jgi:hypothetical protein
MADHSVRRGAAGPKGLAASKQEVVLELAPGCSGSFEEI